MPLEMREMFGKAIDGIDEYEIRAYPNDEISHSPLFESAIMNIEQSKLSSPFREERIKTVIFNVISI